MTQWILLVSSSLIGLLCISGLGYLIFGKTGAISGLIIWTIAIIVLLIIGFSGQL